MAEAHQLPPQHQHLKSFRASTPPVYTMLNVEVIHLRPTRPTGITTGNAGPTSPVRLDGSPITELRQKNEDYSSAHNHTLKHGV